MLSNWKIGHVRITIMPIRYWLKFNKSVYDTGLEELGCDWNVILIGPICIDYYSMRK